jgi:hypothetical protein
MVQTNGIGVNTVVDFRECALEVPFKGFTVLFVFFEALKFLNQKQPENCADSRTKFKSNVFMRIRATIFSILNIDACDIGFLI